MDTQERGNAVEAEILGALIGRGFAVLIPFGGGHPYDLVMHLRANEFLRIQCKSARRAEGRLLFNSCSTDHGRGRLPYTGLADLFGIYCADIPGVFLVPVKEAAGFVSTLRLTPPRNNQRSRVRLAADYEIGQWTPSRLFEVLHRRAARLDLGRETVTERGPCLP